MKVTYSATIGHKMTANTVANRILTQNLLSNPKLDVTFNMTPVALMLDVFKELDKLQSDPEIIRRFRHAKGLWRNEAETMLVTINHIDDFLSVINGDYLLYSMGIGMFDLLVIKRALEKGLKVVVGGGYALTIPFERTRKFLKDMGCSDDQLNRLIIVKGFVDLHTDLYEIIKQGKDYIIKENDFKSFWECKTDYFNRYLDIADKLWTAGGVPIVRNDPGPRWHHSYVAFTFNSKCWWNKCKFCLYTQEDLCLNLLRDVDLDWVTSKIVETLDAHKSNALYLSDNYFLFNRKNEPILKKLKEKGIKIGIYTGIIKLKEKEYVEKINKYITYVNIGLESTSDFTLDYICKGYKQKDVIEAFDNIIQNGNRDVTYLANVIFDLPYYNTKDFWNHVHTLLDVKEKMTNADFEFGYNPRLLSIPIPLKDQLIDNRFIKETTMDNPNEFGRTIIWKYLTKKYNFDISNFKNFGIPFVRYDFNGNIMWPDVSMMTDEQSKYLGGFE
jgi:hypothetical protein